VGTQIIPKPYRIETVIIIGETIPIKTIFSFFRTGSSSFSSDNVSF